MLLLLLYSLLSSSSSSSPLFVQLFVFILCFLIFISNFDVLYITYIYDCAREWRDIYMSVSKLLYANVYKFIDKAKSAPILGSFYSFLVMIRLHPVCTKVFLFIGFLALWMFSKQTRMNATTKKLTNRNATDFWSRYQSIDRFAKAKREKKKTIYIYTRSLLNHSQD